MEYKEFTGKNVNDAIMKASIELTTSSDDLDIKVISEGSSGFFGLGSKPAIIKVCRKKDLAQNTVENTEVKTEVSSRKDTENLIVSTEPASDIEEIAKKFLEDIFRAMDMEVTLSMKYNSSDRALDIEFIGQDMGILIGKRGQTLDSLQYLTNLVVNKEQQDYVRVKLDTENYRKRRKETLENLARNIAFKVKKTRKSVSLEPMNPYERRIIHSALQGNKFVETYSEGNEPFRHVVVTLKK